MFSCVFWWFWNHDIINLNMSLEVIKKWNGTPMELFQNWYFPCGGSSMLKSWYQNLNISLDMQKMDRDSDGGRSRVRNPQAPVLSKSLLEPLTPASLFGNFIKKYQWLCHRKFFLNAMIPVNKNIFNHQNNICQNGVGPDLTKRSPIYDRC